MKLKTSLLALTSLAGILFVTCSSVDAQIRRATETLIAELGSSSVKTITASPNLRRVAFWSKTGKQYSLVLDGKPLRQYDDCGVLIFSPDSKRLAYTAKVGKQWVVGVEDKESKPYESIKQIVFSRDSARLAFIAEVGKKQFVVEGSNEGSQYDRVRAITFSPESKRLAYVVWKGEKRFIVVDGEEMDKYDATYFPVFSPDGSRLAYVGRTGEKLFMVENGKEGKQYDDIKLFRQAETGLLGLSSASLKKFRHEFYEINSWALQYWGGPIFSPDSRRLAYMAKIDNKWFMVVDDKEGQQYDEIFVARFSPDSKRLAYVPRIGKRIQWKDREFPLIVDDQRLDDDVNGLSLFFSPDSRRIATVGSGMKLDGKPPPYAKLYGVVGGFAFSPDSQRIAFWTLTSSEEHNLMVVEGVEGRKCKGIVNPLFSPDSKRVAYACGTSKGWTILVDTTEGAEYEATYESAEAGRHWVIFDSPNKIHYLAMKNKAIYLIEETID